MKMTDERLFRENCIVSIPGTFKVLKLHVSTKDEKDAVEEYRSMMKAWRDCLSGNRFYNGSKERLTMLLARKAAANAYADKGRRTVFADDVIVANGHITEDDFL